MQYRGYTIETDGMGNYRAFIVTVVDAVNVKSYAGKNTFFIKPDNSHIETPRSFTDIEFLKRIIDFTIDGWRPVRPDEWT